MYVALRPIHGDTDAGWIAARPNVVVRKSQFKAADAWQTARGGANLSRKVGQCRDVVANNRRRVGKLRTRQLHAVTRVSGEANCYCVQLFNWFVDGFDWWFEYCAHCFLIMSS